MTFTQLKRKFLKEITIENKVDERGISYSIFTNTPNALRVKAHDKGKQVWVAGYPRSSHIVATNIDEDEVEIKIKGESFHRYIYSEEVILHPKEWKEILK